MSSNFSQIAEVIQADREAAAHMLRAIGAITGREFDAILRGKWNKREEVLAFARHRTSSIARIINPDALR